MKRNAYDIFLNVLLAILIIGVIGTAGYLCYKYYQKYKLNSDADQFLNDFDQVVNATNTDD